MKVKHIMMNMDSRVECCRNRTQSMDKRKLRWCCDEKVDGWGRQGNVGIGVLAAAIRSIRDMDMMPMIQR